MDPRPADLTGRRVTWTAYLYLSTVGFLLYAIGVLTPYLRDDLRLSAAQAALHPSALAAGVMAAGTLTDAVERRLGRRRAGVMAAGLLVAGGLLIASGPALPVTLAGAFMMGLGAGAMLATVNLILGQPGGAHAEMRFARANTWSMLASFFAPIVIAAAASSALGWRAVPLLALTVPLVLEAGGGLPAAPAATPRAAADPPADPPARLPRAFWVAWLFVVTAVSIEFSYVVWGSSVLAARTGLGLDTATALAAAFLAGMLLGRIALGTGLIGRARFRHSIEVALAVIAIGSVIVWLAPHPAMSAAGLLLAGLGTGTLYPQGMAIALDRAGDAALAAGARLTLASGLAILVVPLVLGGIADAFGVVTGWPMVIALCAVAYVLRRAGAR